MGMEPLFALPQVDVKLGERHVRGAVLVLDFLLATPAAFGGRVLVAAALSGLVTAHRLAHELVADEVQAKGAHFALDQHKESLYREPYYLIHGETRLRLRFDCQHCQMLVYHDSEGIKQT